MTGLLALPPDVQRNICSYLGDDLIQTVPYVCRAFEALSKNAVLWNTVLGGIIREVRQWTILRKVAYSNRMAIRYLVPEKDRKPFLDLKHRPFEQRFLLLQVVSDKIDQWLQTPGAAGSQMFGIPKERVAEVWQSALRESLPAREAPSPPSFNGTPLTLVHAGNPSYFNTTLRAFLSVKQIWTQLNRPLFPRENEEVSAFERRFELQQELMQFIQMVNRHDATLSYPELVAYLLKFPSLHRLLEFIFNSDLHCQFSPEASRTIQDARDVAELFIDQLFPLYQVKTQKYVATDVLPNLHFLRPQSIDLMLQLHIPEDQEHQTLVDAIHASLGKRLNEEDDPNFQLKFYPEEGIVVDPRMPRPYAPEEVQSRKYYDWTHLVDLPPILVMAISRMKVVQGQLVKNDSPLRLPKNGIVDLSAYATQQPASPEPRPASPTHYKIKSYVTHDDRNFWAKYELNGAYYDGVRTITKEQFLKGTNAYILILEKLSDDEVKQLKLRYS